MISLGVPLESCSLWARGGNSGQTLSTGTDFVALKNGISGKTLNSCSLFPLNPRRFRDGKGEGGGSGEGRSCLEGWEPAELSARSPKIQGGKALEKPWNFHSLGFEHQALLPSKATGLSRVEAERFQAGNGSVFPLPGYP